MADGPLYDASQPVHVADFLKTQEFSGEAQVQMGCLSTHLFGKVLAPGGSQVLPGHEEEVGPAMKKAADCIANTEKPKPLSVDPPDAQVFDFLNRAAFNAVVAGLPEAKFDLGGIEFDAGSKFELYAKTHGMTLKRDAENPNLVELVFNREVKPEPKK